MRFAFLIFLTMTAFAANSLLTRMAVETGAADPGGFAVVRVLSGAIVLVGLVGMTGRRLRILHWSRIAGAVMLSVYMIGFSLAYRSLDAGLGALVLFGVVQTTMFLVTAATGAPVTKRQMIGALTAFAGLAWVVWPSGTVRVDPAGALLMGAAGAGWAVYTLAGRGEGDPLAGTAGNFCIAFPLTFLVLVLTGADMTMTVFGVILAVLSGAVTSGLGYALWYALLPRMAAPVAATVQLSVPIIAILCGAVLLGETVGLSLISGGALVLGGIALTIRTARPA